MKQTFHSNDDALLRHLGLSTVDAVKRYRPDDLVKNHGDGARDILRLRATSPVPQTLYLKRLWRTARKDALKSLVRHGHVRSLCRQEWVNYERLRTAGIDTPALVAYGEETGPLREHFSFILTASAPGEPVEDFLRNTPLASPLRRSVLAALARFVRQLHGAGLFSPDLFTRHIFVSAPANFTLIDMARLDRGSPQNSRLRARDLAALNITAPLSTATRTERLRFLVAYDPAGRLLIPRIRRRVNYLLKRRKYQPFLR